MAADKNGDDRSSPSPWVVGSVMGALGFEFVGFVLGAVFIGVRLDEYFDSRPVAILLCVFFSLVAVGLHVFHVARRFLSEGEK